MKNDTVVIFVKRIDGKTKAGVDFTAYETVDKNKNRLSVRFVGDTPKPEKSCYIELEKFNENYWLDKRKVYPILRVKEYKVVDLKKDNTAVDNPFTD